jgi:type II secretory pathway pseudopilin PulG
MIVASLALVGLLAQIVLTSATAITRQAATQSMEDANASRDLQEQGKKYNHDN